MHERLFGKRCVVSALWISNARAGRIRKLPKRWASAKLKAVRENGDAGLQARLHKGATPKLTPAQKALLPDYLSHGAEAYGFRGEVWTCARVATVIRREFEVHYHKAHVSRLLQELEWTPQKPLKGCRLTRQI